MTRARYYPLNPAGFTVRRPRRVFLSCETGPGYFRAAAIREGILTEFDHPGELVEYLYRCENRLWVISYNLQWVSILANYLKRFKSIEGAQDSSIIYIRPDSNTMVYLIDYQSFTLTTFDKFAREVGVKSVKATSLPEARVKIIAAMWNLYAETHIKYFGAYPGKTPGTSSISGFKRFMQEPIKPRGKKIRKLSTSAIRAPGLHWRPGYYPRAYMYDINSAYIFAMGLISFPNHVISFCNQPPRFPFWIGTVRVNYKTTREFSPLSVKTGQETVYPREVENHRMTITYIDAHLLEQTGEFEIVEWIEGFCWPAADQTPIFSEWANVAGNLQGVEKKLLKVTTRALHSKFSQRTHSSRLTLVEVDPHKIQPLIKAHKVADFLPLDNGGLAIRLEVRKRDRFRNYWRPDYEALTLAACRLILYTAIDENTIYVDTDSIVSTTERTDLSIGPSMGQWKSVESGPCFIAGGRAYSIGGHVRVSGIFPIDYRELRRAISSAVDQGQGQATAIEKGNLFSLTQERTRAHTIRRAVYPKAQVRGNIAMVSRSPAVKQHIRFNTRKFSRRKESDEGKIINRPGVKRDKRDTPT